MHTKYWVIDIEASTVRLRLDDDKEVKDKDFLLIVKEDLDELLRKEYNRGRDEAVADSV